MQFNAEFQQKVVEIFNNLLAANMTLSGQEKNAIQMAFNNNLANILMYLQQMQEAKAQVGQALYTPAVQNVLANFIGQTQMQLRQSVPQTAAYPGYLSGINTIPVGQPLWNQAGWSPNIPVNGMQPQPMFRPVMAQPQQTFMNQPGATAGLYSTGVQMPQSQQPQPQQKVVLTSQAPAAAATKPDTTQTIEKVDYREPIKTNETEINGGDKYLRIRKRIFTCSDNHKAIDIGVWTKKPTAFPSQIVDDIRTNIEPAANIVTVFYRIPYLLKVQSKGLIQTLNEIKRLVNNDQNLSSTSGFAILESISMYMANQPSSVVSLLETGIVNDIRPRLTIDAPSVTIHSIQDVLKLEETLTDESVKRAIDDLVMTSILHLTELQAFEVTSDEGWETAAGSYYDGSKTWEAYKNEASEEEFQKTANNWTVLLGSEERFIWTDVPVPGTIVQFPDRLEVTVFDFELTFTQPVESDFEFFISMIAREEEKVGKLTVSYAGIDTRYVMITGKNKIEFNSMTLV